MATITTKAPATITKSNGVFYLNVDGVLFANLSIAISRMTWLQMYNAKYAFILNSYTRKMFAHDMMPLIKSGDVYIDKQLLSEIRYFVQNPKNPSGKIIAFPPTVKLMPHQLTAMQYIVDYNRFAFHLGPGTGKTMIAISAIMTHCPKRTLIVTPKAVKEQFANELNKHLGGMMNLKTIQDIVLTNFEQLNNLTNEAFDMVIVDEAHRAKSYTTGANKALRKICKSPQWVYLFTGTPQDHSRHEVLPQLAILDERVMPFKTVTYERYFEINDYYQPSREIKARSEELTEIIKSYTWGKPTDECLSLPEENIIKVMCPEPTKEYYELVKKRTVAIGGGTVVADSKATLRLKLREMCCGHVVVSKSVEKEPGVTAYEDESVRIENHKIGQLRNLLLTVKRGLIFTEFTADVDIVRYVIDKGTPFKCTTLQDRTKVFNPIKAFKDGDVDFLILNSKAGGTGLDLSCTNNAIFYSLPESDIVYYQAKMRIRRHGQTEPCNYYHLLCRNSVELQQFGALQKKRTFNNSQFKIYS